MKRTILIAVLPAAADAKKDNSRVISFSFETCVPQTFMGIMFNNNPRLKVLSSLTRTSLVGRAYSVNNIFTFQKQEQFS